MCIVQRREAGKQVCQHPAEFGCAQAGCADWVKRLLQQHGGLVALIEHRQWPGEAEYADLIQEGRIGVWLAILRYEPERGLSFSTYAGRAIRNRVWNAVRRAGKAQGGLEPQWGGDKPGNDPGGLAGGAGAPGAGG